MKSRGRGRHHATFKVSLGHTSQVQGCTLAGNRLFGRLPVNLDAAHAHAFALRENFEFFIFVYRAADQRAGDDRTESFHGENAINGEASQSGGILNWHSSSNFYQSLFKL